MGILYGSPNQLRLCPETFLCSREVFQDHLGRKEGVTDEKELYMVISRSAPLKSKYLFFFSVIPIGIPQETCVQIGFHYLESL